MKPVVEHDGLIQSSTELFKTSNYMTASKEPLEGTRQAPKSGWALGTNCPILSTLSNILTTIKK